MAKDSYFYALGRRKSSTARVRLSGGKGVITINDKPADAYFADSKFLLAKLQQPFIALDNAGKFDVSAHVSGGGQIGRASCRERV